MWATATQEDAATPRSTTTTVIARTLRRCRKISRSDFLHQLVAIRKLLDLTGLPLDKLLSFWADISTAGEKSLYSRLFLTHNLLGIDKVFKSDTNGNYLTQEAKISDHMPVLMAALKMKADDVTAVLEVPSTARCFDPGQCLRALSPQPARENSACASRGPGRSIRTVWRSIQNAQRTHWHCFATGETWRTRASPSVNSTT